MSQPNNEPLVHRVRRVNVRGLAILGGLILVLAVGYFPLRAHSNRAVRNSALAQVESIAARGDVDLALRHVERYLANWPDDVPALEVAARLRYDSARTLDEVIQAAGVNDQLVRLDPDGKGRQETRRRLIKLWLRQGDVLRLMTASQSDASVRVKESRYRSAATVARQLIDRGAKDSEAHRLMARALDGVVLSGDPKPRDEAVREYEEALRLDPGDFDSAERLAQIDLESRNDPASAIATLDALLKARPDSADVRLARHRHFTRAKQDDRAKAELTAAIALAPKDITLRVQAARDALRRNDPAGARAELDAVPESSREDTRIRMLRGMVELTEQRPDEAIEQWRRGLAASGGGDLDLTFQLANAMIQLDRLAEARPLVAQFQRLETDESGSMGRYLRALLEQRSGHPARAIEDLERARDRIPEGMRSELQLALGRCHESLGDESRAMLAYRRALVASPRSPEPRRAIARLLMARNPQEAVDEFERALAQSPEDPTLLQEAGQLQLARQLALPAADRKWQRLEEILQKGDRIAPAGFGFRSLRANYLIALGKSTEAVELLGQSARGPDRKRLEAWITWARMLNALGRRDEALGALADASAPDAAGDHVKLRTVRAAMLAQAGQGRAAREVLEKDRGRIPRGEWAELSHAEGDLARLLGDREAARAAYLEWSRQIPESPEPGIALLGLGRLFDDDEASRLGQQALLGVGGDREPYGLVARVNDLLRVDRARPGPPSAEKLDQAERLLADLELVAPQLPAGFLLRGILLEYREKLPEAATAYRSAMKDQAMPQALVGLVGVLTKLKRFDELTSLQKRFEDQSVLSKNAQPAVNFDQISAAAALKLGDKGRAEYYASKIVEQLPESPEARAALARLLDQLGKPREAEATLRALVDRRPDDPAAWVALVTFQAIRGEKGDAAKTIEQARAKYKGERPEILLGRCFWLAGDLDQATRQYAAGRAKRPDDLGTLAAVADFDNATGRLGAVESVLRRALKIDPSAAWAARALALRLSGSGDPAAWSEAWSLVAPGPKTSGDSPEERLTRALILARSPDLARRAEAVAAMSALANDLPATHAVAIDARLRLSQSLLDANRTAEAALTIAPVAESRQADPGALAIRAEALARSGRPDEAQAPLDRLAGLEPKSPRTAAVRAWVLLARGKAEEAGAAIEAGVAEAESAPEGEGACLALFGLARRMGRAEVLGRLADRIAARWPRDAYLVAQIRLDRGQHAEALAACRAALGAGSAREALRVGTSLALVRRDDPAFLKEVDALAEAAHARAPKDFEVAIFQATIRHLEGRYEEEVALYREALSLNPPVYRFLNNMAWTLAEGLGRLDEALERIDEAIRRSGATPQFLDTRGVILARKGRLEEALADLKLSAQSEPQATTYFHLARTAIKAGKPEDARLYRDQATKAGFDPKALDPTDRTDLEAVMKAP